MSFVNVQSNMAHSIRFTYYYYFYYDYDDRSKETLSSLCAV